MRLIVEAGLRMAGVGFSSSLLVPCTVKGSPASCYNLFFAAPYFPAGMVHGHWAPTVVKSQENGLLIAMPELFCAPDTVAV